ncbi:hypothetical protein DB345_12300 [Spartobacteria bacterium LR76]|nr:hypothetical protein DB345_12300 [Spartobacteria bacterium LR76]
MGRTQDNRVMTCDATGNLLTVTEPDASKAGKADVGYTYDAQNRLSTLPQESLASAGVLLSIRNPI